MALEKQGEFSFKHIDQPDVPMPGTATPQQWKENLDSQADELKDTLNQLIDDLEATTDTSGAEQIGSKAIEDLSGNTVYALLKDLRDKLRGTSGASFISASTGDSVESVLQALALELDEHKTSGDHDGRYNTKTELQSTTAGSSGAHQIGSALISGIPAGTLYSQLVALKAAIDGAVTGNIPDGSLTDVKLSDNAGQIKERVSELQTNVEDLNDAVAEHVADETAHNINRKLDKSGGTMTGQLIAQANAAYGTAQVRNILAGTADPTGTAPNGALYIKYKP